MGDLEKLLPVEITATAARSGEELVIRFSQAKEAIRIASQNGIAVLGVEAFRILDPSTGYQLGVENYSGYGFELKGVWRDFVDVNNEAAFRFLEEHCLGDGYGYILTSTSESEFNRTAI